ncbi:hypothetical protein D4R75_02655 [bacterium]|nr:MAG: hypothetical protein D4R75_02655 [bacterium]
MNTLSRLFIRFFLSTSLVLFALLSQSCMTDSGDNIIGTGTVVFLSFEGGFYGIKADDGRNYDPMNLPEDLRKDGLRVRFEAKELKDRASFHMWGTIVELVHIQKL